MWMLCSFNIGPDRGMWQFHFSHFFLFFTFLYIQKKYRSIVHLLAFSPSCCCLHSYQNHEFAFYLYYWQFLNDTCVCWYMWNIAGTLWATVDSTALVTRWHSMFDHCPKSKIWERCAAGRLCFLQHNTVFVWIHSINVHLHFR